MAKVSKEAAEDMLQEWQRIFDAELDSDDAARISRAIQSGRLDFDEDTETFNMHLVKPVELKDGTNVTELEITELDASQLKSAMTASDPMEQSVKMLSAVSGQPVAVIDRLKMRDFALGGAVCSFFA